jgi:hypothetical protein
MFKSQNYLGVGLGAAIEGRMAQDSIQHRLLIEWLQVRGSVPSRSRPILVIQSACDERTFQDLGQVETRRPRL